MQAKFCTNPELTPELLKSRRVSQYEMLMRKFSEAHKVECNTVSVEIPKVHRAAKRFPTGSQYEGDWDVLGMSGMGIYTFPNGVVYIGGFVDGKFDGEGELQYPDGEVLRGTFSNGVMTERKLIHADGLYYSEEDFKYCRMPDRRFTIEYDDGVRPGEASYMTAEQPSIKIPPGYYDTGDGFYNAETKMVYRYDNITAILRAPLEREQKWIVAHCRKSPSGEVGPRQDLYEQWLEPEVELDEMPLPACMSVGTENLFLSSTTLLGHPREMASHSRTVSISDYSKWLNLQRVKSMAGFRSKMNISPIFRDDSV